MKNLIKKVNWTKGQGLVPAVIQDANTSAVLMLGYMNKESFAKTLKTKKVWFYSRSKQRLWMKGETSKNILNIVDIKLDCDNDAILIKAKPVGPTCHTGAYSCFKESKDQNALVTLFNTIQDRKNKMPKNSYTTSLFKAGLDKISLKVAEEALEVVHAAQKQTQLRLTEEAVDLFYHLFVLLVQKNVSLEDVQNEIIKRR
ncbi:MAG: bifunctional phosphoribosyl-AMP cyclohydrolase/phosphoribosyl-ATP diphosphatase HisIE [Patescibacteria group bacterium]